MKNEPQKPKEISRDLTGDIGEHYVCHVLPQWGIHAVLTRHNAEKVDVIAYCKDTLRSATVQVKTYMNEGRALVINRTESVFDPEHEPMFEENPTAAFWALVLLNGASHQVKSVHIWDSKRDRHLLKPQQATQGKNKGVPMWTVNPYARENQEEWEARKDDNGWHRLAEVLKTPLR